MLWETPGVRVGSLRWWFEHRETGKITVAQFPNWPLFGIGFGWVVRHLVEDGSTVFDIAGAAIAGLWLYWGAGELFRGVNPWRRVLGSLAIGWQAARLIG